MESAPKIPRKHVTFRRRFADDAQRILVGLIVGVLFPGTPEIYGDNHELVLRTYLALNHTCRRFRYWEVLRRWIGYLCRPGKRQTFFLAGFPVRLNGLHQPDLQLNSFFDALANEGLLTADIAPKFESFALQQSFARTAKKSAFEADIAEIPFFNLARCWLMQNDVHMDSFLCFKAATPPELLLFVYAFFIAETMEEDCFVFPAWKSPEKPYLFFQQKHRKRYLERELIGDLKKVMLYAPQEPGFLHGPLKTTSPAHFFNVVESTRTRGKHGKRSHLQRVEEFVLEWFPTTIYGAHPAVIDIPILFEDGF